VLIFAVYIMDFIEITLILGAIFGVVVAAVSYCDNVKRTIAAMIMGIIASFVSQSILFISGIPYKIILFIYRNDTWVQESGRLSVNEVIGYNFGTMIFWQGLLISFVVLIIVIFLFHAIKSRLK